jgi:triacylglycerol esterase/lipase EstA (alpha/beta hydrolase family)
MNKEKLLENGIVPQYLIAIVLLAIASLLVVLVLAMGKVNEAMAAKSQELRAQETRYDYQTLSRNAENLRNTAVRLGLERFDIDTASLRLLNYSDYINQRYKANIVEGIIKGNHELQVRMRYTYTPTSVEDFVSMIDDLTSREAPATYISTMTIRPEGGQDKKGSYFVEGELIVSHPFYDEGGNK